MPSEPIDLEQTKQRLQNLLANQPAILFAILYGSVADSQHDRDLDIAIYVDPAVIDQEVEIDYALELSETLTRQIQFPVDVRVVNHSPLGFRYNVTLGKTLYVKDPISLADFRENTWNYWFDFKPVAMQYLRE